eukprot:Nitzschia sp. Nitz4//scaffold213_size37731//33675//35714//NITZ4_007726-RA/size37731-processed-gene-0.15-mRNA-1//-1//CDS//3329542083//1910//frame0
MSSSSRQALGFQGPLHASLVRWRSFKADRLPVAAPVTRSAGALHPRQTSTFLRYMSGVSDSFSSDYSSRKSISNRNLSLCQQTSARFASSLPDISPSDAYERADLRIELTPEEEQLFQMLRTAKEQANLSTTLRVAGGWVRDKLLATPPFAHVLRQSRLGIISNSTCPASEQNQPVDIDIALDDMLGREFAERLNEYLDREGEETHTVGVVLRNPEKSKHLETATMKVGEMWIDFVNLRTERYSSDSRIPDLMGIGTPVEDAYRRDLTINTLFYNIDTEMIEDWTGRGCDDLLRGVVATPLAPLTTLLDDPLRALRSVRFAARFGFEIDDSLVDAIRDSRVNGALREKVSQERIGCELDLMLRSMDPVGAFRHLVALDLADVVFPMQICFPNCDDEGDLLGQGLQLLDQAYHQMTDMNSETFPWIQYNNSSSDLGLQYFHQDEDARRLLCYAAVLMPLCKHIYSDEMSNEKILREKLKDILVGVLKRPSKDFEAVTTILVGATEFSRLVESSGDDVANVLQSDILLGVNDTGVQCLMEGHHVNCISVDDPRWHQAMSFRARCAQFVNKVGPLWRASLILSLSKDVIDSGVSYSDERQLLGKYMSCAEAMERLAAFSLWGVKPLMAGNDIKKVLPGIPNGPDFRKVMDEQQLWTVIHPGGGVELLSEHLAATFPEYVNNP